MRAATVYVFKQFQHNFICFPIQSLPSPSARAFPPPPRPPSRLCSSCSWTFFFYQLFCFVFRITFCRSEYLLSENLSISFSVLLLLQQLSYVSFALWLEFQASPGPMLPSPSLRIQYTCTIVHYYVVNGAFVLRVYFPLRCSI